MDRIKLLGTIDRLAAFLGSDFAGQGTESLKAIIPGVCKEHGWTCEWIADTRQFCIRYKGIQVWLEPAGGQVFCIAEGSIAHKVYDTDSLGTWLENTKRLVYSRPRRTEWDI